ncbi:hypothetical protein FE257_009367 [Aspergillus nanangensis]|uniref:Uncharacterized protein n=1 Tax=Aspergillus nanangensis TaxID=2582783 RepID=A0AAD4CKM8_ASPNN|nr:hypothetical protein FE257_009367 [Aspergillus nanangensis]
MDRLKAFLHATVSWGLFVNRWRRSTQYAILYVTPILQQVRIILHEAGSSGDSDSSSLAPSEVRLLFPMTLAMNIPAYLPDLAVRGVNNYDKIACMWPARYYTAALEGVDYSETGGAPEKLSEEALEDVPILITTLWINDSQALTAGVPMGGRMPKTTPRQLEGGTVTKLSPLGATLYSKTVFEREETEEELQYPHI